MNNPLKKFLLCFLTFIVSLCFFSGCGFFKSKEAQKDVVVWVNDYAITKEDVDRQILITPEFSSAFNSKEAQKDRILDLMIDNTLLLQEAERIRVMNNPKFLKTIEHFFQQSILQELLKIKMVEIREEVSVSPQEVQEVIEALAKEYFARQIEFKKSIPGETFKGKREQWDTLLKEFEPIIQSDSGWVWCDVRDLQSGFRELIRASPPQPGDLLGIKQNGRDMILLILKDKENEDTEFVASEIEEWLRGEKEQKRLANWMKKLRQKADIKINGKYK